MRSAKAARISAAVRSSSSGSTESCPAMSSGCRRVGGGGTVTIEGTVLSIAALSKVYLYSNGRVLKQIPLDAGAKRATFREQIKVGQSAWFSLYGEGPQDRALDGEYPQAATNVIRVYV